MLSKEFRAVLRKKREEAKMEMIIHILDGMYEANREAAEAGILEPLTETQPMSRKIPIKADQKPPPASRLPWPVYLDI